MRPAHLLAAFLDVACGRRYANNSEPVVTCLSGRPDALYNMDKVELRSLSVRVLSIPLQQRLGVSPICRAARPGRLERPVAEHQPDQPGCSGRARAGGL